MQKIRARRAKEEKLKQLRIRIAIIGSCIVSIVIMLGFVVSAKAEEKAYLDNLNNYDKYYTQVYIDSSTDTVWGLFDEITSKYPDTGNYDREDWIEEVRYMNHLDYECSITYGNYIAVPYLNGEKN